MEFQCVCVYSRSLNNMGLNYSSPRICKFFRIVNIIVLYDRFLVESMEAELLMWWTSLYAYFQSWPPQCSRSNVNTHPPTHAHAFCLFWPLTSLRILWFIWVLVLFKKKAPTSWWGSHGGGVRFRMPWETVEAVTDFCLGGSPTLTISLPLELQFSWSNGSAVVVEQYLDQNDLEDVLKQRAKHHSFHCSRFVIQ